MPREKPQISVAEAQHELNVNMKNEIDELINYESKFREKAPTYIELKNIRTNVVSILTKVEILTSAVAQHDSENAAQIQPFITRLKELRSLRDDLGQKISNAILNAMPQAEKPIPQKVHGFTLPEVPTNKFDESIHLQAKAKQAASSSNKKSPWVQSNTREALKEVAQEMNVLKAAVVTFTRNGSQEARDEMYRIKNDLSNKIDMIRLKTKDITVKASLIKYQEQILALMPQSAQKNVQKKVQGRNTHVTPRFGGRKNS